MKKHTHKILKLLSAGFTAEEIAAEIGISAGTTKNYIELLKRNYKAKNSAHLVAIALRGNVIK